MGMPFYGRTWTLPGQDNGFKSKAVGEGGNAGMYTQQAGMINYNELCLQLKAGGWTVKRNSTFKVPYAVKGNQWISFDDAQSIKDKVGFLKSKGLAGGMIYALENDDHAGLCGQGTFPLLRTIAHELNNDVAPGPHNTVPPPRTTVPPTWVPPTIDG